MRLRRSNQNQRFRPSDLNRRLGLSDEDEDTESASRDNEGSPDEGFVDDGQPVSNVRIKTDEEEEEEDVAAPPGRRQKSKLHDKKPGRQPTPDGEQSSAQQQQALGVVQEYPTDPSAKWTRSYAGPVKRWTRLQMLTRFWFGDRPGYFDVVADLARLWWQHQILPPKLASRHDLRVAASPWMPAGFPEAQRAAFNRWYERYLTGRTRESESALIDMRKAARWFPPTTNDLTVINGDGVDQKQYYFTQGEVLSYSGLGALGEDTDGDGAGVATSGWLLDVGGIVVAMGWAPSDSRSAQLLAMAVVPFSDQAYYPDLKKAPRESDRKEGAVQIWRFETDEDARGLARPARRRPRLAHALCFSWGRPARLQWCPVPLTSGDKIGLLGVLCGDGKLRVLEVADTSKNSSRETFEEVHEPMATITPPREQTVQISCFTWANMNRIAVGHTDGTVALWSVYPCQVLQRHPVHISPIMDIASGYPSHPLVVATVPMGGVLTITDLGRRPNQETSYNPNLGVCVQAGLLSWSEALRGFASIWPSAFAGNASVGFGQVRVYAQGRYLMTLDSPPTCLAVGVCHPCLLAGTADGSLWAVNIMKKAYSHRETSAKMRLFQHEYRAAAAGPPEAGNDDEDGSSGGDDKVRVREPPRGKCRILYGFLPERNSHPKAQKIAQQRAEKKKKKGKAQKGKGKGKSKSKAKGKGKGKAKTMHSGGGDNSDYEEEDDGSEEEDSDDDDDLSDALDAEPEGDADADGPSATTQPLPVHDPQTRITAIAWNPNVRLSWWAAAAMGSGLVRVMDLGVEAPGGGGSSDSEDDDDDEGGRRDPGEEDEDDAGAGVGEDREGDVEVDVEMADGDEDPDEEDVDMHVRPETGSAWKTINR